MFWGWFEVVWGVIRWTRLSTVNRQIDTNVNKMKIVNLEILFFFYSAEMKLNCYLRG